MNAIQQQYETETGEPATYRKGSSDYHTLRYVRWLEAENARLKAELADKQAQLDRVMLEHCHDDMSAGQIEEWGSHQRAVELAAPKDNEP